MRTHQIMLQTLFIFREITLAFHVNRLLGRRFTWNVKIHFLWKIKKTKMSSAAVVVGAFMVKIRSNGSRIQERPEGPNSLTWVSLSLVYSKSLWFLFIGLCMFKICWKWMFSDDRLRGAGQKHARMVPYCWIGMWTRWSYVTKYQRPGPSGFRQKDF